jgi:hypothetical protein
MEEGENIYLLGHALDHVSPRVLSCSPMISMFMQPKSEARAGAQSNSVFVILAARSLSRGSQV